MTCSGRTERVALVRNGFHPHPGQMTVLICVIVKPQAAISLQASRTDEGVTIEESGYDGKNRGTKRGTYQDDGGKYYLKSY